MLTIFTTAKPFVGLTAIHQRNAIRSWQTFVEHENIVMFQKAVVPGLNVEALLDVEFDGNVPYVDSMFRKAEIFAITRMSRVLVYANADIILLPNILSAIQRADMAFNEFLMCGQRWDVHLDLPINFNNFEWSNNLYNIIDEQRAKLHSPSGKDWFAWKPPMRLQIPRLVVGRAGWDNWILDASVRAGIPVIDATEVVTAIHPFHDYDHLPGGLEEAHISGKQAIRNKALANVPTNKGRISEATYKMTASDLSKRGGVK